MWPKQFKPWEALAVVGSMVVVIYEGLYFDLAQGQMNW